MIVVRSSERFAGLPNEAGDVASSYSKEQCRVRTARVLGHALQDVRPSSHLNRNFSSAREHGSEHNLLKVACLDHAYENPSARALSFFFLQFGRLISALSDPTPFDWFKGWSELSPVLRGVIKPADKVLLRTQLHRFSRVTLF